MVAVNADWPGGGKRLGLDSLSLFDVRIQVVYLNLRVTLCLGSGVPVWNHIRLIPPQYAGKWESS